MGRRHTLLAIVLPASALFPSCASVGPGSAPAPGVEDVVEQRPLGSTWSGKENDSFGDQQIISDRVSRLGLHPFTVERTIEYGDSDSPVSVLDPSHEQDQEGRFLAVFQVVCTNTQQFLRQPVHFTEVQWRNDQMPSDAGQAPPDIDGVIYFLIDGQAPFDVDFTIGGYPLKKRVKVGDGPSRDDLRSKQWNFAGGQGGRYVIQIPFDECARRGIR